MAWAIDKQLIRAEEELGVAIFERLPRGRRLTLAGDVLIHRLRGWKKDLTGIRREIGELQGLSRGEVKIAAPGKGRRPSQPDTLASTAWPDWNRAKSSPRPVHGSKARRPSCGTR